MKKLFKIIIILLIVLLIIAGAVMAIKHKKAKEAKIPPAKDYAVVVHTITPKNKDSILTLPYIALAQDDKSVTISSKLAARVKEIIHSGIKVKKAQTLIKLDTTDIKARLQSINAAITAAKRGLEAKKENLQNLKSIHARTAELLKVRGASQEQFDTENSKISAATASLKAALAKVDELKAKRKEIINLLSYADIKAPVSGTVAKTFVTKGNMAMPGKPLMQISSIGGIYLLIRVPQDIKPKALLYKNKKLQITDLLHTFNGLEEYRANLKNSDLSAGERVDIDLITYDAKGLKLPMDALLDKEGKTYVIIAEGKKAKALKVNVIARGEDGVIIDPKGVEGKKVIVEKPDILLKLLSGVEIVTLKK